MYFIANWKIQLGVSESVKLAKKIKDGLKKIKKGTQVVLCPSFDSLEAVGHAINKSDIHLGAQDMFYESKGQFTGEESPLNLKEIGCKYVILGHSERRKLGETNEDVNKKLAAALQNKLIPIVCVGETLKQRRAGQTKGVILKQINAIFQNVKISRADKIIVAYEPVWAIGTGISAKPENAKEAKDFIIKLLIKIFKKNKIKKFAVIYGGSVNSKNVFKFLDEGEMEGALVGGASLKAEEFLKIVRSVTDYK